MMELVSANWWLFVIALAIGIAVAWWIFVANRKTRVTTSKPDVLDEGAAPARRNQALIDAPSAAEQPGSVLGRAAEPAPIPEPVPAPPAPPPPPVPPIPAPKPEPPPKSEPKPKAPPKPKAEPKPKAPKAKAKPAPKPKPTPAPRPEPVTTPEPAPAPAPPSKTVAPDVLTQIKGLGPKMEGLLRDLGVTTFAQIAAWTDADIDRIDPQLGAFEGRIRRDNFVEQAKLLAAGDIAGFEAKFGAL